MLVEQVKSFLVGSDFVGDIPLYQKILAALLTGWCIWLLSECSKLCCKCLSCYPWFFFPSCQNLIGKTFKLNRCYGNCNC